MHLENLFRPSRARSHRACSRLLPWYVNRTLEADERRAVEEHLADCADCRAEVEALVELEGGVRSAPAPELDPAAGLARVLDRIDAAPRPAATVHWVLAAQAAAILVLASLLIWQRGPSEDAAFHTLSSPESALPTGEDLLRVVFTEDATELELRRLLLESGCEIVAGPTTAGAYTLRSRDQPVSEELIARLRQDERVRLVEPVPR